MAAILAIHAESLVPRDVAGSATHLDTKSAWKESSAVVPTAPAARAVNQAAKAQTQRPESSDHPGTRTCIRSSRAVRRCRDATGHLDTCRRASTHRPQDRNR